MTEIKTSSSTSVANTTWQQDVEMLHYLTASLESSFPSFKLARQLLIWLTDASIRNFVIVILRKAIEEKIKPFGHVLNLELKMNSGISQAFIKAPIDLMLHKYMVQIILDELMKNFPSDKTCEYNLLISNVCSDTFTMNICIVVKKQSS